MAFGQRANHGIGGLGADYVREYTMFYICEMTGRL